jgi:diacylglycerol kinase family enzyme
METFTDAEVEAPAASDLHLDGEPRVVRERLRVRVHPRALDVIVPPARQ